MAKARAAHDGDVVDLSMRDGYNTLFAYAEQWLDAQKAALSEALWSAEAQESPWLAGVDGVVAEWMRMYLDTLQATLEQMRSIGEAMAKNQISLLRALEAK